MLCAFSFFVWLVMFFMSEQFPFDCVCGLWRIRCIKKSFPNILPLTNKDQYKDIKASCPDGCEPLFGISLSIETLPSVIAVCFLKESSTSSLCPRAIKPYISSCYPHLLDCTGAP